MSKEYQYRCNKCNFLFTGVDSVSCPDCGHADVTKLMFYELMGYFTGEKIEMIKNLNQNIIKKDV